MKRKNRSLAPIGLMIFGGLLVVGALVILAVFPPGAAPLSTPTLPAEQAAAVDDGLPRVSVGDAKAAFDLEQAVFVDVRERAFYNESHIPGALSIPLNEIEARLGELNSSDWIITYCT